MDNLFVALFEILSFGAIVVLVVLGLGIIASMMGIFNFAQGEFVLLGAYVTYIVHSAGLPVWLGMLAAPFVVGALGFVLERTDRPAILRGADRRDARHLRARAHHPRDRPRLDRRVVPVGPGAARRLGQYRHHALLHLAAGHHSHYGAGDGRQLSAAGAHRLRVAHSGVAGKSRARPRIGHFDQCDLWRDLCVRRRARGPCGRVDRAGVLAVCRSRPALPDSGVRRRHGRRGRLVRGAGGGRRRDRNARAPRCHGSFRP